MYADDLILYGESEEDLKVMVGCSVEVCRRRDLKVKADKKEGGLGCEICVDGARLEQVSEFKYLGCILDESGTEYAVGR